MSKKVPTCWVPLRLALTMTILSGDREAQHVQRPVLQLGHGLGNGPLAEDQGIGQLSIQSCMRAMALTTTTPMTVVSTITLIISNATSMPMAMTMTISMSMAMTKK